MSWGNDAAAEQLAGLSDFVGGLGLDKALTKELQNRLAEAAKKLSKSKDACHELDEFLRRVMDQAGKKNPRLTFEQAAQLLSANQIEALLGCIEADSPVPAAELHLLELGRTIDGLDVDNGTADELGNRVREAGKQLAVGKLDESCRHLAGLSKKIAELAEKGKLTAAQAATLADGGRGDQRRARLLTRARRVWAASPGAAQTRPFRTT